MAEMPVSEGFIISMFGIFGGILGGFLTFLLRSRCKNIKCCCITCERVVLEGQELENVAVEVRPIS